MVTRSVESQRSRPVDYPDKNSWYTFLRFYTILYLNSHVRFRPIITVSASHFILLCLQACFLQTWKKCHIFFFNSSFKQRELYIRSSRFIYVHCIMLRIYTLVPPTLKCLRMYNILTCSHWKYFALCVIGLRIKFSLWLIGLPIFLFSTL